jgi:hypothetical protein
MIRDKSSIEDNIVPGSRLEGVERFEVLERL